MNEPFPPLLDLQTNDSISVASVSITRVFGIDFAALDLAAAVEAIASRSQTASFEYVVTPNATHVAGVDRGDKRFVESIEGAWLRTCDSQIVRFFAWLLFRIRLPQAAGSDITKLLFETEISPSDSICVIGGTVEMANRLRAQYGLRRLAQHIPPHDLIHNPEAIAACAAFVRDNPSRFVFLACGAPQSEVLGLYILKQGEASGLGLCVGASLLFLTGIIRRAPHRWRACGLEWLYRLLQEPRRLARRLVTGQLPFLWVAVRYRLEHGRHQKLTQKTRRVAEKIL